MTNIIVVLPKLEEAKGSQEYSGTQWLSGNGYLYHRYPGHQSGGRSERRYRDLQLQAGRHDIYRTAGRSAGGLRDAFDGISESDQRMLRQRHRMSLHAVKGSGPDQYGKSDGGRRGAPQKKTAHAAEDTKCSG